MLQRMNDAEGTINFANLNSELFENCESWEGLVMAALACQRSCELIMKTITSEHVQQREMAECLLRVSNIMDGIPKYEDIVSRFRNAPHELESCDWVTVARATASDWSNAAKQFLEVAEKIKT